MKTQPLWLLKTQSTFLLCIFGQIVISYICCSLTPLHCKYESNETKLKLYNLIWKLRQGTRSLFDQNFSQWFSCWDFFGWQLCVGCKLHTVCTSKLTERGQNQKRWQNQKVTRCPTLATRATFFKARRCSSAKRVGGKIDVPVCNFYQNRVRSLLATLVTNSVTD